MNMSLDLDTSFAYSLIQYAFLMTLYRNACNNYCIYVYIMKVIITGSRL